MRKIAHQREIREDEYNKNEYPEGHNEEGELWNTYLHMEDFNEDLDDVRFILGMHRYGHKIKYQHTQMIGVSMYQC